MTKILQENYLASNFSCNIIARLFIFCKKSFTFMVQDLQDSYVKDLMQDLASLARFVLQDG